MTLLALTPKLTVFSRSKPYPLIGTSALSVRYVMEEITSLFKFKAGKSRLDGKLLVADTRKGTVEVLRVRPKPVTISMPPHEQEHLALTRTWALLAGPGWSCTFRLGRQTVEY